MTLICEFSNNLYYLDNEYGPFLDRKSSGTITRRGINYDKVVSLQLDACAACYIAAHSGPHLRCEVEHHFFKTNSNLPNSNCHVIWRLEKNVSIWSIKDVISTLLKTRLINSKTILTSQWGIQIKSYLTAFTIYEIGVTLTRYLQRVQ